MQKCVFVFFFYDDQKKYDVSYALNNMMLSRNKSVRITMRLVCATMYVYRIRYENFWECFESFGNARDDDHEDLEIHQFHVLTWNTLCKTVGNAVLLY